jgi:hypothetical protein
MILKLMCIWLVFYSIVSTNSVQNAYCGANIVLESTNTISSGLKRHPPVYGGIRNLESGCLVSRVDIQASHITRDIKRQWTFCNFNPANQKPFRN